MNEDEEKIIAEKYKNELASLRRVIIQFTALQNWLLNASLASLAFAFTVMFQVKKGGDLPYPLLAVFTLTFLVIATAGGFWIRVRYELDSLVADSKRFTSIFPLFRDLMINSPDVSNNDKHEFGRFFDWAISRSKQGTTDGKGTSIIKEFLLLGAEFVVLIIGIICLCIYICLFLF